MCKVTVSPGKGIADTFYLISLKRMFFLLA